MVKLNFDSDNNYNQNINKGDYNNIEYRKINSDESFISHNNQQIRKNLECQIF